MRMTSRALAVAAFAAAALLARVAPLGAQPEIPAPPVETPVPEPTEPAPDPSADPTGGVMPPSEMPATPVGPAPAPPPPEVIIPAPPSGTAPQAIGVVLGGIDKVAARTAKFEANLRQKVFYNTLIITAYACKTRPPEEPPESAAYLEIQERKPDGTTQKLFSGWMFASSPALNALEHPVYDVWVVSCKTAPAANTAPVPPNS
jgi:hypothetical protein